MNLPTDRDAEIDAILPSVYKELRRIATANMRRMPVGTTLQPTRSCTRCGCATNAASWPVARSESALGEAIYRQGRTAEAERYLAEGYTLLAADEEADRETRIRARERITRFYTDRGERRKLEALILATSEAPSTRNDEKSSANSGN